MSQSENRNLLIKIDLYKIGIIYTNKQFFKPNFFGKLCYFMNLGNTKVQFMV